MIPNSFSTLSLLPALQKNLAALELSTMTAIQAQSLPAILAGQDVIAQAKTGSGKTLAFSLGILQRLNPEKFCIQGVVLCPTRELAEQVAAEIRRLAREIGNVKVLTLCGGTPMGPQIQSLQHGTHIIVGTPGRVLDHLQRGRLDLRRVNCFVLDEADRMLDMGFVDEMRTVISQLPAKRQTLLFSATYPDGIATISEEIQREPLSVKVESHHSASSIEQWFYEVDADKRDEGVCRLLSHYQPESAIIFCQTKKQTQALADWLKQQGFSALPLHGDMEQRERHEVLFLFASQCCRFLIATDVAARGLDIKDVAAVINYQVSPDPEVHVHRIGRTGRADAKGLALTLCSPSEVGRANQIEQHQQQPLRWKHVIGHVFHKNRIQDAAYRAICIDGGKKNKLRPGDILGALSKDAGLPPEDIGKILITDFKAYVAIKLRSVKPALAHLREGKIKGKTFRARRLG